MWPRIVRDVMAWIEERGCQYAGPGCDLMPVPRDGEQKVMGTATPEARLIRSGGRSGEWTGLSEEGVAHRAERRCSQGEEGFVEAPEREFGIPGG
jgi:hypothetical protein